MHKTLLCKLSHFQIAHLFSLTPLSSSSPSLPRHSHLRPPPSSMDHSGVDSDGNPYSNPQEMWALEAGENPSPHHLHSSSPDHQKKQLWYQKGVGYWQGVEASVDGVLGGYGRVSDRDVRCSEEFLSEVLSECLPDARLSARRLVALDCGAGVGRVTKNLLLRHFHEVDLVEPVSHFLEAAKEELSISSCGLGQSPDLHKAVNFYCTPLQEFSPEVNRYDVVWVQWCIGHLTDQDLVDFFKRAKAGLKPGGLFVLKENIAKDGFVVDKVDSSVTRSDAYFRDLFQQAGLHIHKTKLQKGFPKELFAVRMYALLLQPPQARSVTYQTRGQKKVNQPRLIL